MFSMSSFVWLDLDSSINFGITFFGYFPLVICVFFYDYFRITRCFMLRSKTNSTLPQFEAPKILRPEADVPFCPPLVTSHSMGDICLLEQHLEDAKLMSEHYIRVIEMSNVNGSGHNEVRWRPRQEASLAPPCSTVRSLGNKCTVGEESICDIAGTFRRSPSDLTPGELCSPCPPSLRPCDGCYCNNYDLQNFKCQLLLPRGEILIRSPMFAQRAVTGLSDVSGRSFIRS